MKRDEIHSAFVRRFAADRLAPSTDGDRVTVEELAQAEAELAITFPESYVAFVTKYGPVFTPSILELLTDDESESVADEGRFDVQEFFGAQEVIKTSHLMWSGGMETYLVPIAMDCMGNVFGFRREPNVPRPDDSPVLFFDHDFCRIHEEAASFDEWLNYFVQLPAP